MAIKSRAQENGASTKRLRRMAAVRLERIRRAAMAIRFAWDEQLDDPIVRADLDAFDECVDRLESDLAAILEYHEEPIGAD